MKSKKLIITIICLLGICLVFGIGWIIDKKSQSDLPPTPTLNGDPYIELSIPEGEIFLVGDVVKEWMKMQLNALNIMV